jgi:hypothetical protein
MLSFTLQDAKGVPFRATITSMDVESWLQDDLLSKRTQQHKELRKQIADESKGRIKVTIKHLPGRPLLSGSEADTMLSRHFVGHTGTREVDMRDQGGLKIEGYGDTSWGALVEPMGRWPTKLPHPTLGPKFYYLYLLQSSFASTMGLCGSCHQPNCSSKSQWHCKVLRDAQRLPQTSNRYSRPMRGFTTLTHAYSTDPMAMQQSSYYQQ